MSIDLTTVDGDGLFDILGKAIHAAKTLITAAGTTVPAEIDDFIEQYKLWTGADEAADVAIANFRQAAESNLSDGAASLLRNIASVAESLLVRRVAADGPQPQDTLDNALAFLLAQMEADGDYVSPNVVGDSLAAGGDNSATDLTIAYTLTRADGRDEEDALAEDITLTVSDTSGAVLAVTSTASVEATAVDWPVGSGVAVNLTISDTSLLQNSEFEEAEYDDAPDDWIVLVGEPGTDILLTTTEVGRLTVSGTPESGYYMLGWTDPVDGVVRYSATKVPFDGDGPLVEAALRSIPGLESVTVETTGDSPDYVHDITFTGVAGNVANLLVLDSLVSGSVTPSEVTAGESQAFRAKSLVLVGDGAVEPELFAPIVLEQDRVYFVHYRVRRNSAANAGELSLGLTEGVSDSILDDDQGDPNELALDIDTFSTSASESKWFSVRLPSTAPIVGQYLRIKATGIPNTGKVWIDDLFVREATQLYPGGPYLAAFPGRVAPLRGDTWTLTISNDRAGEWQTWFDRLFSMRARRLLLPSDGSNLLNDSLIG